MKHSVLRLKRILALGIRLATGLSIVREDICREFEISERTFFRDIEILRDVLNVHENNGVYSR